MNRNGLFDPKRVIFFCLLWLSLGFIAMAALSCGHTRDRAGEPDANSTSVESPAPEKSLQVVSEDPVPAKRRVRRNVEEVEAELEQEREEKNTLKEENDWLRVQVIQLQEDLITANQNIYALNRKLDAIFKSN